MRKLLIALSAAALILCACQKELSFDDPNSNPGSGGGGGSATKLVTLGVKSGTDSTTTTYVYNGNYISQYLFSGTVGGQSVNVQQRYTRNANHLITSSSTIADSYLQLGIDSLVTIYTVDNANSRYIRGVTKLSFQGVDLADSVVFNYDGAGKLTSAVDYFDDGTGYAISGKEEYSYTGNNLTTVKSYSDSGNGLALDETTTYEYDNKVNPTTYPVDAPVLGMEDFYSANNATKSTSVTTETPPQTTITTVSYTYNSYNQPTKGLTTQGTATATVTYHYQ